MTLFEIIKALQTTSGNNAKQAILDANKDNPLLKAYMKAVLDPAINYWQTKLPKALPREGEDACTFDREGKAFFHDLDRLAAREVTGKAATKYLASMISHMSAESVELLGYIIKRKIAGANVGETMVLKTWPGLMFIPPYMRCGGYDEKARQRFAAKKHFYWQPKRDGSFAYIMRDKQGKASVITRSGSYYPQWLADAMADGLPRNCVMIGEMEVYKTVGATLLPRKEGNGVLNSVLQGAEPNEVHDYTFELVAWDMLEEDEFKDGNSGREYCDRLREMEHVINHHQTVNIVAIETIEVDSLEEALALNTKETEAGREGSVIKTMDGKWKDGTSKECIKLKIKFSCDYKLVGFYQGTGKASGMLGGITVETACGKLHTNVGTGFNDEARINLWQHLNEHGCEGLIVEVEANDVIDNRDKDTLALSLPVFVEIRRDKKEADTLERVLEQLAAARAGK